MFLCIVVVVVVGRGGCNFDPKINQKKQNILQSLPLKFVFHKVTSGLSGLAARVFFVNSMDIRLQCDGSVGLRSHFRNRGSQCNTGS